jgi:hypothetical protein
MRMIMGILLLGLAACASPSGAEPVLPMTTTADGGAADGVTRPADDLRIELDRGDGTAPEVYTLTCLGSASGDHPDAEAACAHLAGLADPFAPIPADVACTEQYGGPETAHLSGVWGGEPVDLELSRVDGCRISQWDGLGPLLPGPVGLAPPS